MKYLSRLLLLFITAGFIQLSYSQDVPYVPTSPEVVNAMLTLAEVSENDVVYDLGCGDGRIVVAAARDFGAKGVGVDSNPVRIEESKQNAKQAGVTDKVEFYEQNLFETDIKDASVIAIYLLNSVNLKLRPKFLEDLKPGTRIVSHAFDMDDWEPTEHKEVDNRDVYLWIVPENASGNWKDENITLELDQEFQKINGTITAGSEQYEISEAELDGKELTFTAEGSNGTLKFEGEIDGDKLSGRITSDNDKVNTEFNASRIEGTKRALDPTASMSGTAR
jgi:precorrin-6B methylase 2